MAAREGSVGSVTTCVCARLCFAAQQGECGQGAPGATEVGKASREQFLELSVPRPSSLENSDCICVFPIFTLVFGLLFPKLISSKTRYLGSRTEKARFHLIHLVKQSHFHLYGYHVTFITWKRFQKLSCELGNY